MCIYPRFRKKLNAFALISVLVLLSILSLLALEFAQRSGINLKMAVNHTYSTKALYYAYGGYQAALALLKNDTNSYDGPGDFWYGGLPPVPFGEGSISITIEDEKARFNLRNLVSTYGKEDKRRSVMLSRMFRFLSIEPSLVDGVVDWQDSNDIELPDGAEASYYHYLTPPFTPRNGRFITTGELFLVKGMDRDLLFLPPSSRSPVGNEEYVSLMHYITVYGDGKININTASKPVLLCLSEDMDEFIVNDIIEYREDDPFKNIQDLKNVETVSDILYDEINSLITVKSNLFRISATGMSGGFSQTIMAVVLRDARGFRVVYYNRSL